MAAHKKDRRTRRGWRSVAMIAGVLAVAAGGSGYWLRTTPLPHADAQTPITTSQPAPAPRPVVSKTATDYSRRAVAFLYDAQPVSREQLGEYLIERHADKLDMLVNKRIIDDACRQYNIEVTGGEIENALAEQLQGFAVDQKTFVNTLLARYHKNLYEWKEDIVRSRLQLAKLCRSRAEVSDDELRKAFESQYGEKIECQIILYPKGEQGKSEALADYAKVRDSADEFDQKAKAQKVKPELAATAGKVRAFGRYVMGDDNFDRIVFRLQPNEVSEVFDSIDGPIIVKCLRRLPADATVRLESVRDKLMKELMDRKVVGAMQSAFDTLKRQANAKIYLTQKDRAGQSENVPLSDGPRSQQIVAVYNGQTAITREDFGEFLIARYGSEQIEFLLNKLIIDRECQAHNIQVSPEEIEAGLADDLKKVGGVTLKVFEKDFLAPYNKNVYEWREDVVRSRIQLAKLSRDRVKVQNSDLQMAFEAEYGERLEGRMILWPADQTRFAMMEYTSVRDNPVAFDEKAKHQASGTLASRGGRVGPFGRHMFGNDDVEKEAFNLHPGEMTTLIETPEGNVVFKLEKRIPADTSVTLDSVRDKLTKEVFERKVQLEMQVVARELRDKAKPKVMIKDANRPVDLVESTKKLLGSSPDKLNVEKPIPQP